MSVLSRPRRNATSTEAPGLPKQRAGSDELLPGATVPGAPPKAPRTPATAAPQVKSVNYRRRRAALVLASIAAVVAAGVATTVSLMADDEAATVAPSTSITGVTSTDQQRDAAARARSGAAGEERATDALRDGVLSRRGGVQP